MIKKTKIIFLLLIFFTTAIICSENSRPTVGLVLSGGGARGFAHIGVLKVLKKAGIEVDFIAGTSMGSIIGGLHSIGYTPEDLDSVARTIDWSSLFNDEVNRYDLPIEEKKYTERYIGGISLKGLELSLPMGLISGQNIQSTFNELTWKVIGYNKFDEFPKPFICVAADVENAEAVVLDSGGLSVAMRTSMSLPTIFTPMELENKLLVDGGVIRNFPVQDMIDLGADIIIGVDVGTPMKKVDELTSAIAIINQIIGFRNTETNKVQRQLCDILIIPDLDNMSSFAFADYERFIELGESSAMEIYDDLVNLADSLNNFPTDNKTQITEFNPESLYFSELQIVGLENVTRNLVEGAFPYNIPCWLDRKQISEGIEAIYSTLYFEKVTYSIKKGNHSDTLVIEVKENKTAHLNLGLRYDSYDNIKMLLNGTFRNIIFRGSKLILDLKLWKYYSLGFDYYSNTDLSYLTYRLTFNLSGGYTQNYIDLYENSRSYARLKHITLYMKTRFILTLKNNYQFNIGVILKNIKTEPTIGPSYFKVEDKTYAVYFANLALDRLRTLYYPRKGVKSLLEVRHISPLYNSYDDFTQGVFDISFYIPFHRRITFFSGIYSGITLGDNIPENFCFHTGGFRESQCGNAVYGYYRDEISGKQLVSLRTGIQFEPWNNRYFTLQWNIAKTSEDPYQLTEYGNYLDGYGIKFGVKTPFGPIDFTIAGTNIKTIETYINIGYEF